MTITASDLKKIVTEARPIIERQLEDAERLAGLREVVASAGGDWGQLKALIKAQIQDENDDAGDGKRVRKILDKAEYANAYADMLGFAQMNKKNYFADDQSIDAEQDEFDQIAELDLAETRPDGRGKAESASGEAPDTAPQHFQAKASEGKASTAPLIEAPLDGEASRPSRGGDTPAPNSSVAASAPAVRAERHNDDPRCLDKAKCGAMSNFAFCIKCRAAWRERHPLEAA